MMKPNTTLTRLIELLIIATCLLSPRSSLADVQKVFCVSPSGSDKNPGTEARPLKTIEAARNAVRAINRKMTGDIEVVLRGGTFRIDRTIVLDHRDSGSGGHNVIYKSHPGETPVISGGKPITGWQPGADGRWKAKTDVENFRQLYVNGVRAVRARGGKLPGAKLIDDVGYTTTDVHMADWGNPDQIEFVYYATWCHTRCKVESIKRRGSHAVVTMLQPHFRLARTKEGARVGVPHHIENALELLETPGEWYLDRGRDTVYYMPRPGEDMNKVDVIAPVVETLIELRGTLDQPVQSIHFVGITLAEANWLRPSEIGLVDLQANFILDHNRLFKRAVRRPEDVTVTTVHNECFKSPSNVICRAARRVRFERCTFTRLGSGGIDLEFGSQDNVIVGCHFHDLSGTAVQVGDVLKIAHHPDDPRAVVKNNAVVDNYIHHVCLEYKGGLGVFAGYTEGTIIAHNEICHVPYSGISVGWGWGEEDAGGGGYHQPFFYKTPTTAKNNRIEFNYIHHAMQELADGGGIYTLSNQPGTVIRGNHIHDVRGGAIYLDEGSGFIEVTGNVAYNYRGAMWLNNRAQNRIATCNVHDNYFDFRPGGPPLVPGRLGKALHCDGTSSYIEVPHSAALEPEEMTVESWVRLPEYPGSDDTRRWIVNKNTHEFIQSHYALMIDGKKVGAYLNIGGGQSNCHETWSEDLLKLDHWHHLAMSYDGSVLKVYLDAELVTKKTIGKKRVAGSTPLHIGRRQDGFNYFKGDIDEVRIYSRALSSDELKSNYQTPDHPAKKGLAGRWGFDKPAKVSEAVQRVIAEAGPRKSGN